MKEEIVRNVAGFIADMQVNGLEAYHAETSSAKVELNAVKYFDQCNVSATVSCYGQRIIEISDAKGVYVNKNGIIPLSLADGSTEALKVILADIAKTVSRISGDAGVAILDSIRELDRHLEDNFPQIVGYLAKDPYWSKRYATLKFMDSYIKFSMDMGYPVYQGTNKTKPKENPNAKSGLPTKESICELLKVHIFNKIITESLKTLKD